MPGYVHILATLDTKGHEAAFLRDRLAALGVSCRLVDTGCLGEPAIAADISRDEIFAAAGTPLVAVRAKADRGEAVALAAAGASAVIGRLHAAGEVAGVLGLGGGAGTAITTAAMRALPLGVPKVMLSTLASGDVRGFVNFKDIVMVPSIVDILGLNRISRMVLDQAARVMAGLVQFPAADSNTKSRPLVAATMFGVTTPCVERARKVLEEAGYETLVFHATGTGGQAMEALIADRQIAGVLDITTTELADELCGGVLSAGPQRLTAAAARGVPQVVSVGATDMVNFWAPETVPERFRNEGRRFYQHNPQVTLMRTTAVENAAIGADLARKVAATKGPAAILLPRRGVSAIDGRGQPFDDPDARAALFSAIRCHAGPIAVEELDLHINDPAFADAAAERLLRLMKVRHSPAEVV